MQSSEGTVIIKANGERELFKPEKLFQSLVNSGADSSVAHEVTDKIYGSLAEEDKTEDIYNRAFDMLRQLESDAAARYSVKRALMDLGPSGYPFETFLSEIYKALGYETKTGILVQGRCVEHEIDVVATKGDERIGAEVKFHNKAGIKSDLKVALYVQARFEDIAAQSGLESETDFTDRLLITNTKFTKQVEIYAACVGIQLISWDFPAKGNLQDLIEQTRVHPVSCLTTLSNAHKQQLMDNEIVLCRQLEQNRGSLEQLGLSADQLNKVYREVDGLVSVGTF